jgi:ATP-dependent Clp protease adapter protein ClpS
MPTKIQTNFFPDPNEPPIYLVYIRTEKHIPWGSSMKILTRIFNHTQENAKLLAQELAENGEALCGAYLYDVAETKATIVERYAKKAEFSVECLLEDV